MIIALDAMGGDKAPKSVLRGADIAVARYPDIKFMIFGDKPQISSLISKYPKLLENSEVLHSEVSISPEEKASTAIRQAKNSSIGMAVDAVKQGKAEAAISSGNTGALMAISKLYLKTLNGIDRPAICSLMPTRKGQCAMLDLGANSQVSAENLFQFAVMGDAFIKAVLGKTNPTVGLLNIGSESVKGIDSVKQAAEMLKNTQLPINYYGFVEGNDIANGTVDVVVTDGFTGNIALKTAEGFGRLCSDYIKMGITSSVISRIGGLLARPALRSVFKKIDPRSHNGAMFLGLNGIIVKSHGGTDHIGFANAIEVAVNLVKDGINGHITEEINLARDNDETT